MDESYIFEVLEEDGSYLDSIGGLDEIRQQQEIVEQGFQSQSFRDYARKGGADMSTASLIRETDITLNKIDQFQRDQDRELSKLLTGAQDTTSQANTRLDELVSSLQLMTEQFNARLEEQRINAQKETEASLEAANELDEARRRALTGEGMIKQVAPARALGIGEIMTQGRAARGGSQRAATSEFLRNPPMIGAYDG
jgi:hypothetical protein